MLSRTVDPLFWMSGGALRADNRAREFLLPATQ